MGLTSLPLEIPQGETFTREIEFLDSEGEVINLTDYTAKCQFRQTVEATDPPVIELSTEDGSIVIDGVDGTVTFTIPASVTAEQAAGLKLGWDLFIYSDTGVASRLIGGEATIVGSFTK